MIAILSDIFEILKFVRNLANWIRDILKLISSDEGIEHPVAPTGQAVTSSPIVTNPSSKTVSDSDKLGMVTNPRFFSINRLARRKNR